MPPHILCKELQLKSTKIEQIASNEKRGNDSYMEQDAGKSKITKRVAERRKLEFELFVLSLFVHFDWESFKPCMGCRFLVKQIQLFKYILYFKPNSKIAHLLTKGQHSINELLIAYCPK